MQRLIINKHLRNSAARHKPPKRASVADNAARFSSAYAVSCWQVCEVFSSAFSLEKRNKLGNSSEHRKGHCQVRISITAHLALKAPVLPHVFSHVVSHISIYRCLPKHSVTVSTIIIYTPTKLIWRNGSYRVLVIALFHWFN